MFLFLLCSLSTFAISSAWLYSPGPKVFRDFVLNNGGKLAPLAYCQLCSSFWFGIVIHFIVFGNLSLIYPLAYSGISWLLGSIALYFQWGKAYYEKELKH